MSDKAKVALWIALILAVILGLVWQFFPLSDASDRLDELPRYGAAFVGNDVPLTPFEQGVFAGVNVVKRVYTIAKKPYFVTVIDGTHNRHVVHDPYYCFHGGGWQVISDEPYPIPGGEARLVVLKKGDELQQALYWFTDGKKRSGSALFYWWQATLRRLSFGQLGEEPVLVVIQPMDKETLSWDKVRELFPALFQL